MFNLAKIVCGLASLCVVTLPSAAQDYVYAAGNPSYSTQIPIENGFIDLDNGNLHFELSLSSHPQRGKLALNERLVYDSRIWKIVSNNGQSWQPTNIPNSMGGWRFTTGLETGTVSFTSVEQDSTDVVSCQVGHRQEQDITESWNTNNQFVWADSQGTPHMFSFETIEPILVCSSDTSHNVATGSGYAVDGSGYFATVSGYANLTVYDTSGNQVYPVVQDTNGNFFSQDANGNLVDTVGNTPVLVSNSGNQIYYDVLAWNGSRQRYTVTTETIPFSTQFGQFQVGESSGSFTVISQITLPDGSAYSFSYDSGAYGELTSITLPTGGTIGYNYVNYVDSYNNRNRWISSRTKDGVTTAINRAVLSQCSQVGGTGNCQQQATVVTPAGDTKIYNFYLDGSAYANSTSQVQSVEVYNGPVTQGATPAITQSTVYQFSTTTSSDGLTSYILPATVTTATSFIGSNLNTQQQTTLINGYLPASVATWDFYQNPVPTTPTKVVNYTYNATVNGAFLLTGTQTTNGSGPPVAQSTIGYDATTPTATSGLPNHASILGNSRGNPTSVSQWVNTTNTWNTSTSTYDDAGVVLSTADANGNPATTFTHDAVDLCVTSVTRPTTNAVQHISHSTCDASTGLLASTTDENSQTTTYNAYDAFDRLLQVTYPDGGQSVQSYPSPTQIVAKTLQQLNVWNTVTTSLDSYGRQSHVTLNDPAGDDSVDYTYDGNGRVHCVSNAHRTAPSSTDGNTCVTSYDALDRPLLQQQPDGNTLAWSYSGNVVTSTDEAGNSWRRASNVGGQVTNVVEPGNLQTSYTYDVLGNLLTIAQNGTTGDTPQTRSFTYDSLSRMLSATTPEAGTSTYNYDANGNLHQATDARSIPVTYSYDALNRLTDKQSPGAAGVPGFHYEYAYDTSNLGTFTSNYPIGRLVDASNLVNASEQYSYDSMGRIVFQGNTLPSTCCTPGTQNSVQAQYDLSGNMTSLTYPDGRVVTQAVDSSGRLQNVVFDNWNGQHVGYPYASAFTYTPAGSQAEIWLGGAYIHTPYNNRQRMCQVWSNSFMGLVDTHIYYGGSTTFCNSAPGDNGNVTEVKDWKNPNRTRYFGYDSLNRLNSFGMGPTPVNPPIQQSYAIDSFGNLKQSGSLSYLPNYGTNNQIISNGYGYDFAGNVTSYNDGISTKTLQFDAENKLINFNGAATYTYEATENRSRKDAGGTWTEYVNFNGQALSERYPDGSWIDYIYANGQRIAKVDTNTPMIHAHGVRDATINMACGSVWNVSTATNISGYAIRAGDQFVFDQNETVAHAGPSLGFTDGTYTAGVTQDQNGIFTDDSTQDDGLWHHRMVDLSSLAGKTVNGFYHSTEADTPAGTWDVYYDNVALVSTDGLVQPIFTGQLVSSSLWSGCGGNNLSLATESTAVSDPGEATTYYIGDQIGSMRMTLSAGGWPLSSYTYYPFGQEQTATTDTNHFKFATLERDQETGMDHATFRQYSSSSGRWMSPDPYIGSYDLSDPQSFNRYAYVSNASLSATDPSGLVISTKQAPPDVGYTYFLVFSGNLPGFFGGGGAKAPKKGFTKNHCPLFGPCYKGPALPPSCLSQAATSKAAGTTALDAVGAIPGAGNILHGIQFGAAVVAAGVSTFGSARDASLSATGAGLAIADKTGVSITVRGAEVIPILGNFISGVATGYDIFGEGGVVDSYTSCLAGTHP
jgi:RHS repeat-associated protein